MWTHRSNGPMRIIHRTRTTFTTCTPTWRFWTTSAKSVAWTHSYCGHIAVKPVPFSIWYAGFWCLRIFRMGCCCVKCLCSSISIIWHKSALRCHHSRIIRYFWTIIETHCPSIWRADYASRSVQTIHCNFISQRCVNVIKKRDAWELMGRFEFQEPLMEEYSIAAQVWKLSSCDMWVFKLRKSMNLFWPMHSISGANWREIQFWCPDFHIR